MSATPQWPMKGKIIFLSKIPGYTKQHTHQPSASMTENLLNNRLAGVTSPYLLQHADNPVHWQPWDTKSLTLARELDRPILLSIGYSACHWCHVMAHESFANTTTARLMNQWYVCIKVDREERPDLDKTYQLIHQILTRRAGGWPLTLVLDPATLTAFFAATYLPPEPRYGMPAFADILRQVASHYQRHKDQLPQHHEAILQALSQLEQRPQQVLPEALPSHCLDQLQEEFDPDFGGFGGAPKFPQPTRLAFCLHFSAIESGGAKRTKAATGTAMAQQTLSAMANGGLFDHLAGGFFRYSTDEKWQIPHFEKMLYDNAQLLDLYAKTWVGSQNSRYLQVAEQTIDWMITEIQAPTGGYYSSLDADTEGTEGRYYVWSQQQAEQAVTATGYRTLALHYGLDQEANFAGYWHLQINQSIEHIASQLQQPLAQIGRQLNTARTALLQQRQQRVRPALDDKILCAWNAMACAAMARAGWYLNRPDAIGSAVRGLRFIREKLWKNGRLLAVHRAGISNGGAFLDDYAHTLDAILAVIQVHYEDGLLEWACELTNVVLEHFITPEGDFFFTADDEEIILHRHRPAGDDAIPSGNGVMAKVLGQLGALLAEPHYLQAQAQLLQACSGVLLRSPTQHTSLLCASLTPGPRIQTVILRGPHSDMDAWLQQLANDYIPTLQLCLLPNEAKNILPALADKPVSEKVVAYYCQQSHCLPPIHHHGTLLSILQQNQTSSS